MTQTFALTPLGSTGTLSFIALLIGLIGVGVYIYYKALPQTSKVVIAAVLLPMVVAFSWMFYKVNDAKLIVTKDSISVDVPFYQFSLPIAEIDVAGVRQLNWSVGADTTFKPDLRVNGVGMPGFQLGWFSLVGQSKAFVAVTEVDNVVLIPTAKGYPLLLSLEQPQALLSHFKQ
ncbi:PH domain-containing protein [Shewanella sp. 10N.286.54.B9]|uniref:PH domain-containing protein n=1 Tax=Shewanella sp. 10N.286.54.B9 TaxID=3229719 RepID=UPI00354C9AE5